MQRKKTKCLLSITFVINDNYVSYSLNVLKKFLYFFITDVFFRITRNYEYHPL